MQVIIKRENDIHILLPHLLNDVVQELGNGYKENIYQKAIEIELQRADIIFHSEVVCQIMYKGIHVGWERADIVTYKGSNVHAILELKAQTTSLSIKEVTQLRKYMLSLKCDRGYVINFFTQVKNEVVELFYVNNDMVFKYNFKESVFKTLNIF